MVQQQKMATKSFILLIILIQCFSLSLTGLVQGTVVAEHHLLQGNHNYVAVSGGGGGTDTRSGGSSPDAAGGGGGGVIPVYAAGSTDHRNNNHRSAGNSIRSPAALGLFATISVLVNLYRFL